MRGLFIALKAEYEGIAFMKRIAEWYFKNIAILTIIDGTDWSRQFLIFLLTPCSSHTINASSWGINA